jgi:cytoskeletal protein CcmA (bactofilin family)
VFCLTELKCSIYADGELPEAEAREVTRHLASCGACRRMVDSLRLERSVLTECLQITDFIEFELEDEVLAAPQAHNLSIATFAAFVLAMAVLLRPVFAALEQIQLPLSASTQFNLVIDGVLYGIPAVIASITTFLNIASWVVIAGIACFGLFILFRRSPIISSLVSLLALLTVFSPWSYAIDVRRGEKPVTVPAGETIDDTLVVTGDASVDIEGTLNGDLIAIGPDVRVKGTVKGNVVSFAQRTEIDGTVEGSVLGTGGFVEVRGHVGHNLYGVAASVGMEPQGRIDGNAVMLVGEATIDGAVNKDLTAYSARSIGWGPFSHSMVSRGGVIQLLSHARIGRNFFAKVDERENAVIDSGAMVGGKSDVQVAPIPPSRYATASFYIWQTIWLVGALVTGLILLRLVPAFSQLHLATGQDLLLAGGMGFVATVATPVAAVIACLTLIGLPLGLMTIGLWAAAVYLSKIIIAVFLGRSLLAGSNTEPATALMLLCGLLPIFVATNLPFVGGIVNFLLIVLGMGGMALTIYRMPRANPSSSVPALSA